MTLETIKGALAGKAARHIFTLKTHSPKILFVAGTVGVLGTVVLACRATLKVGDVLDEHEKVLASFEELTYGVDRKSDEEIERRKRKLQIRTAVKITKPYLPAIGLGLASIAALTGSHIILTKRNTAVMAAYGLLQKGYDEYRSRVREEYGADIDRRFAVGSELVSVEEKTADGKTVTTQVEKVTGKFGGSPYSIIFDERSRKFSKEPGRNAKTVQMIQSYANDKLRFQGHLTLNEVFEMLDMPKTEAGFVVGWVYDVKNKIHTGDNYVDFGFFTGDSENVKGFIDGESYYCVLDFNVDGDIHKKVEGR